MLFPDVFVFLTIKKSKHFARASIAEQQTTTKKMLRPSKMCVITIVFFACVGLPWEKFSHYFYTPGPPLATAGTPSDTKHHFVEIFRYLGQHFASEGLPKRARRPPQEAQICFFMYFGAPAEALNPIFSDISCRKNMSIFMCFLSAVLT